MLSVKNCFCFSRFKESAFLLHESNALIGFLSAYLSLDSPRNAVATYGTYTLRIPNRLSEDDSNAEYFSRAIQYQHSFLS
ncbi:hypothetical protein MGA5115_01024 [Marinomonas gallaica]|uniref:Uncharacterized protein n=1 Tax=Marinomonas gallaica TaxID=1806667 RepID=A0A1C3JP00_9GAMM|nr:hypothetical protein MGA5115_01024 [Marinomonas gallaica]SBT22111.1 hypothetical protein MGA5116_02724 [Marinomonas gallaica]